MFKRGQMKLSFGMIFSIILIIFFLVFAFFAIQKFLDLQTQVTIKTFYENLGQDINKAWVSTKASKEVNYNLPSNVEEVCIDENKILLLGKHISERATGSGSSSRIEIESKEIKHLEPVNSEECEIPTKGKIGFRLTKNYNEALVKIEIIR